MIDEQTLMAEVVRLRECEEYPFEFWQVAAILNARYPGLALTTEQTRTLHLMQRFENDLLSCLTGLMKGLSPSQH